MNQMVYDLLLPFISDFFDAESLLLKFVLITQFFPDLNAPSSVLKLIANLPFHPFRMDCLQF